MAAREAQAPVEIDLTTDVVATRLEVVDVDDFVGLGIDDLGFDFPKGE